MGNPGAAADLRCRAVELRQAGGSYRQILEALPRPVSKSTLSLWLRDVELTPEQHAALAERRRQGGSRAGERLRENRVRRETATMAEARAQVSGLTDTELFVAGVTAYWAEGTKSKPWRADSQRVVFVNSDAAMIRLFLRWLALIGVDHDRLIFRVAIHESADLQAAHDFWAEVVGVGPEQFGRPTLKRHRPTTNRKNVGHGYNGCLSVTVRRSTELYRQIAGWWLGLSDQVDRVAGTIG